jgi:hypothetical protein
MTTGLGADLESFVLEHEYCGGLDGAVEDDRVWMRCMCRAAIVRALEPLC